MSTKITVSEQLPDYANGHNVWLANGRLMIEMSTIWQGSVDGRRLSKPQSEVSPRLIELAKIGYDGRTVEQDEELEALVSELLEEARFAIEYIKDDSPTASLVGQSYDGWTVRNNGRVVA